jgi:hypothetical protein
MGTHMTLLPDSIACSLLVVHMRKDTNSQEGKVDLDSWPSQHFVDQA